MAYPTDISAGEIAAKKPMTTTLWGKVRDWIYYLLHNSITGPVDFTRSPDLATGYTETALGADGSYVVLSKLIVLPPPPTGKKWRLNVRFYLIRTGGIDRAYTVQIWDYEASSSVSTAAVTHTGNAWINHYLYATTAWTRRYIMLKIDNTNSYYSFRRPSVAIDLVDV